MAIKKQSGFTLIEVLIVIGIIAILASIVIVGINPARQFAKARNAQRISNINAILNAVGENMVENKGLLGGGCPTLSSGTVYTIAKTGSAVLPASSIIDMSCLIPNYLPSFLPADPSGGLWISSSDYNTAYNIALDANGRYTISAPNAELGEVISITR